MQTFLKILRWSVGLLFIFSGLIKANDPLGLSYKMQEFFDVWGIGFISDNLSYYFAVMMNVFEIVAGIALLIKFPYKQTLWLLLVLIVFFSFLTGYALFSGKIKTCGCFGDCIPLTPKTSFIKDILLLIAILILLFYQKKVKSKIKPALGGFVLLLATVGVSYGQYFVTMHLPIIDCLPYKVGNNISEKMKLPPGAVPDSTIIQMEFVKDGKSYLFEYPHFPENFDDSYVYKSRKDVVKKGNGLKAEIVDFNLSTLSNMDTTQALFTSPNPYVLVFAGTIDASIPWEYLLTALHAKHKDIYIVTADKTGATRLLSKENILIADNTMIKTAARVWPTIFVMNGPVIMQKKSYLDLTK